MNEDMNEELEFSIRSHEGSHVIRVSPFDDGVWFGLSMSGCSAYTRMTKAEAQQLIDALTEIVKSTS